MVLLYTFAHTMIDFYPYRPLLRVEMSKVVASDLWFFLILFLLTLARLPGIYCVHEVITFTFTL